MAYQELAQQPTRENMEELPNSETNIFKTRVIESEINSSLFLQVLLYYNFWYSIVCFAFQLVSVSFKVSKFT